MSDPAAFSYDDIEKPNVFLQWKGTDACFDFHCECGEHGHFDGAFAYNVRCAKCKQVWQMPFNLFPRKVDESDGVERIIVDLEADDDD